MVIVIGEGLAMVDRFCWRIAWLDILPSPFTLHHSDPTVSCAFPVVGQCPIAPIASTTEGIGRRRRGRLAGFAHLFREVFRGRIQAMFYGAIVWDPWLILSQIVCIQCLNYVSLGLLLWFLVGLHVPRFTLQYFFDFSMFTTSTRTGWCIIAAFLLNALAGAGFLLLVVERAKKCVDFTVTMYIIHLFLCLLYGGLPSSITWWVVNGIGIVIMAVLGEWLCLRREVKEIPIRSTRTSI